jgi:flagellum-specific peptidoglycan hydrolase FlgJ
MKITRTHLLIGGIGAAALLVAATPTGSSVSYFRYTPYKGKYPPRIAAIEKYGFMVQAACKNTGLFASLMMAQMLIESNNGESYLTRTYNNFFGIQNSAKWTGRVTPPMKDVAGNIRRFRVYDSAQASFADRVLFLQQNPRYVAAKVFQSRSAQEQAQRIDNAGYAEALNYAQSLISIMDTYNLYQLDKS